MMTQHFPIADCLLRALTPYLGRVPIDAIQAPETAGAFSGTDMAMAFTGHSSAQNPQPMQALVSFRKGGMVVIFDPLDPFDDARIRRQRLFEAEIQMGALPVLDGRIAHLDGGLVEAAGSPLSEQDLLDHAVHGHLCGQHTCENAEIG